MGKGVITHRGYIGTLIVLLFILSPGYGYSQIWGPYKINEINIKDNRINANLQEADISNILGEIGRGMGIKMSVGSALVGKKVTGHIVDLDIENALRLILRSYYYVLTYERDPLDPEKKNLKEVIAPGDAVGSIPIKGKLITIDIPYGDGQGQVGIRLEKGDGLGVGPVAYGVDGNGDIYVLDNVNKRVHIYSSNGKYRSTINLNPQIDPYDMVVDSSGTIFVYGGIDGGPDYNLFQYGRKGNFIAQQIVDRTLWKGCSSTIGMIKNKIFMNGCGEYLMGKVENNTLVSPSQEELKQKKGNEVSQAGKLYKWKKRIPGNNAENDMVYSDGAIRTLSYPYDGVLSREFLGEDAESNFYFKTATVENKYQLYNVDKFDINGIYIGTAQLPGGQYYASLNPPSKGFLISGNGNIYNFMPEENSLKIFIFIVESN